MNNSFCAVFHSNESSPVTSLYSLDYRLTCTIYIYTIKIKTNHCIIQVKLRRNKIQPTHFQLSAHHPYFVGIVNASCQSQLLVLWGHQKVDGHDVVLLSFATHSGPLRFGVLDVLGLKKRKKKSNYEKSKFISLFAFSLKHDT